MSNIQRLNQDALNDIALSIEEIIDHAEFFDSDGNKTEAQAESFTYTEAGAIAVTFSSVSGPCRIARIDVCTENGNIWTQENVNIDLSDAASSFKYKIDIEVAARKVTQSDSDVSLYIDLADGHLYCEYDDGFESCDFILNPSGRLEFKAEVNYGE